MIAGILRINLLIVRVDVKHFDVISIKSICSPSLPDKELLMTWQGRRYRGIYGKRRSLKIHPSDVHGQAMETGAE